MTSFRDACRTYDFDAADQTRLQEIAPALDPHVPALAVGLAIVDADDITLAWLRQTLGGPWDAAYAAGLQLARGCVERGVPWHRVCEVFAALRTRCLELVALLSPAAPAAVAISLGKILDLQLAAWLACYPSRAAQNRHTALQTLSSGLAHELRNPLNSARLQLDLLERRLRKANAAGDMLAPIDSARQEIDRLGALVTDFIAFAQPRPLALSDADTQEVLASAVEAEHELADARSVDVSVDASALPARIDRDKLQQVVQHLLRNAIEATPPGGTVVVANASDAQGVHVTVTDTGSGIPEPVVRRIYEPFFSTKEGGTGLGMSIVQSLVALHGGTVSVATSPAGTRIDVALPAS